MQLPHLIVAAALLVPTAFAQNTLEIHPGVTSFTSRGNIGTGDGETLQGFHSSHWAGIGDTGTSCDILGMGAVVQDQNRATQETFHWVLRNGDDTNGPATGTSGEIAVVGPVMTPPQTGTGPIAWQLTSTFSKAVSVPCDKFFAGGVRLNTSPNWSSDGQSTHAATGAANLARASGGDHAWQIIGNATSATNPSSKRTWRYMLQVGNPVLQVGTDLATATTLKFGSGGMFPSQNATQKLGYRVLDDTASAGAAVAILGGTARQPGFPLFAGTSRVYIFGTIFVVGTGTANASGDAIIEPSFLNPISASFAGATLHWQAASLLGSTIRISNSNTTDF